MSAAKHSVCNAALPLFAGEERIVIIFRRAKKLNIEEAKIHYVYCGNDEFNCTKLGR